MPRHADYNQRLAWIRFSGSFGVEQEFRVILGSTDMEKLIFRLCPDVNQIKSFRISPQSVLQIPWQKGLHTHDPPE